MDPRHVVQQILMCRATRKNAKFNRESCMSLIDEAKTLLSMEYSTLILKGDFKIVGDIHGNIDILLRIFAKCGYPDQQKYVFLGDYVDRGNNSVETVILLFALKILFPENIYLLRGNHECRTLTAHYGFKHECLSKTNQAFYDAVMESFDELPLCAILNDTVFLVHGGPPVNIRSRSELMAIEKTDGEPSTSDVSDMLWSDPSSKIVEKIKSPRGAGFIIGEAETTSFLERIGCQLIIRSHETCSRGFDFPFLSNSLITIFSSADYCGRQNSAAIASVKEEDPLDVSIIQFCSSSRLKRLPIPVLPQFILEDEIQTIAQSVPIAPVLRHCPQQDLVLCF